LPWLSRCVNPYGSHVSAAWSGFFLADFATLCANLPSRIVRTMCERHHTAIVKGNA
jgi:hypothetical protein